MAYGAGGSGVWSPEGGTIAEIGTYGPLEQVGERFTKFLNYLLEQKPALYLHVEPMNVLYNPWDLIDFLSLRCHERCCYPSCLLDSSKTLVAEDKIKAENVHSHGFGGTYVETFS